MRVLLGVCKIMMLGRIISVLDKSFLDEIYWSMNHGSCPRIRYSPGNVRET
jgi:hypothetical protein